jgi:predicted nucleic acid-binding protein
MTRYLLDTNIISEATKPNPSRALLAWLDAQLDRDLFISSMTVAEVWRGILELPVGSPRRQLESWFSGSTGPLNIFADRVLYFDNKAAVVWAELMSEGSRSGKPRSAVDMIFAAIAKANDCVMVTDNERHFADLSFVNPKRR